MTRGEKRSAQYLLGILPTLGIIPFLFFPFCRPILVIVFFFMLAWTGLVPR